MLDIAVQLVDATDTTRKRRLRVLRSLTLRPGWPTHLPTIAGPLSSRMSGLDMMPLAMFPTFTRQRHTREATITRQPPIGPPARLIPLPPLMPTRLQSFRLSTTAVVLAPALMARDGSPK